MSASWRGNGPCRFLITGGAGFIGSHLAETLLARGHMVTVIDNLSTGRFENIVPLIHRWGAGGRSSFRFAIDTITNAPVLDRLASECDTIVHLAAAVGVKLIVEQPVHTIETNVMGTEAVLKAAMRYKAEVLIASTSEVYGKGQSIPFSEDDDVVLGPTSRNRWGYAASKMVDEFLALAYHREKGLPVKVFRLFNTVGPRQTGQYGMVLPTFVSQALLGRPLTVYGDGRQARCFLHVRDAVDAVIRLADCPEAVGGVFNVGSVEETTIADLAHLVLQSVSGRDHGDAPKTDGIVFVPYEQAYAVGFEDMTRRVPDIRRISKVTGWTPSTGLQSIVADVVASMDRRRPVTAESNPVHQSLSHGGRSPA